MAVKESIRPGGRSARVQASVHRAVRALLTEMDRTQLTIPLIAARAGVTPSTIYRRWGELPELLADVALERLRPDAALPDTGTLRGDLAAWAEQYAEEMASGPGREMIRDVLAAAGSANACQCRAFLQQQLEQISRRAAARGEMPLDVQAVIDHVVAPILYRLLFDERAASADDARDLVTRLLVP